MRSYKRSAKGRAAAVRASRKYRANNPDLYRRRYSDPVKRARILANTLKYYYANRKAAAARHKRWRDGDSPSAKRYMRRHSLNLPASAPEDLCVTAELLRTIKKEMKSWI